MAPRRIPGDAGRAAIAAARNGSRADLPTAVRYLLQVLAETAPGGTVEVRVPPYGATQAVEGPRHTRGTPPNVIELDPATWLAVATGERSWAEALSSGAISASGQRADLAAFLPLPWETMGE